MTAGLEANLKLAVDARVMLRRNIDTKKGLVNGAIGNVIQISSVTIKVKFDHIAKPYEIERVKTRFLLMKNFYMYRKQFPLILAYAVTIHKCQGLSLDCAIINLSQSVFGYGMAYVALSRVRSLSGLYITELDSQSIKVSNASLMEVNRLRQKFRTDLPMYSIPSLHKQRVRSKRKLTAISDLPAAKRKKVDSNATKMKTNHPSKLQKVPSGAKVSISSKRSGKSEISNIADYDPRTDGVWPFS